METLTLTPAQAAVVHDAIEIYSMKPGGWSVEDSEVILEIRKKIRNLSTIKKRYADKAKAAIVEKPK